MDSKSTRHITMILSWLLGYLGADRFYNGQILWGVLKLITLGACGIWWLIDAAYYTYKAGESVRAQNKQAENAH